ncbi:MAG: hypothetical protein K9J13_11240 [Saprospiraceae bacterium]|nr:hypothetical protein [Saprospiraceae bacterium]
MKNHIIQFLLSIIVTVVALFLGFLFSIETPVKTTENYVLLWVLILNGLWLVPFIIYYRKKKLKKDTTIALLIFFVFIIPFIFIRAYSPKFDSEIWKNSINKNRTYGGIPAYSNGEMVEDLIESEILIGKTIDEIEFILGRNHFKQKYSDSTTIWYFYQNQSIFDGCDKIYIEFENNKSVNAEIGGCD